MSEFSYRIGPMTFFDFPRKGKYLSLEDLLTSIAQVRTAGIEVNRDTYLLDKLREAIVENAARAK